MNIFTKDDYRKIQAWLKANSIKDSDLTSVNDTIPEEDTLVLVQKINGILSNVKISIKDLLNSTLSKIIIDTIIANAVKVNNTLTVTASNVKIDNEKGTTLQDIIDWTETIEEVAKGWNIEYQVPSIDEPTVRAKYVLKDSKGIPKGDVIKVYKDSAITNVYLGTTKDTCNENTGEVTKEPVQNNNEALSIVYRLDTGKYALVNVPIGIFTREAEFDKYRGLGITENGQVFIKLASDVESSNYLHFNDSGELSADGIENRILQDLGTIINSVANDGTMWGQYKKEEGTKDSPINEASRWGQYKQAEADRSGLLNIVSSKVNQLEQEQIQGGVYDVSTHNNGAVFESIQTLLSSSNLSTLIPPSVRHGGMSICFVQSSDNKYVQYRLMTTSFSSAESDWQGVDDKPTTNSKNLVKSGGVYAAINNVRQGLFLSVINDASIIKGQISKTGKFNPRDDFNVYIIQVSAGDYVHIIGQTGYTVEYAIYSSFNGSTLNEEDVVELGEYYAGNRNFDKIVEVSHSGYFAMCSHKSATTKDILTLSSLSEMKKYIDFHEDISANNNGTEYASLDLVLAAIKIADRKSGMSIRYIDANTHEYVQYRYNLVYANTTTGNKAFLNTENWSGGTDEKPTAGSKNLVTSKGIYPLVSNNLCGKNITIIGDDLSTFKGYTSTNYYPNTGSGVNFVEQTWWYNLILKNNAILKENLSENSLRITNTASVTNNLVAKVESAQDTDVMFLVAGILDNIYYVPLGDIDFTKSTEDLDDSKIVDAYIHAVRIAITKATKVYCVIQSHVSVSIKEAIIKIAEYYKGNGVEAINLYSKELEGYDGYNNIKYKLTLNGMSQMGSIIQNCISSEAMSYVSLADKLGYNVVDVDAKDFKWENDKRVRKATNLIETSTGTNSRLSAYVKVVPDTVVYVAGWPQDVYDTYRIAAFDEYFNILPEYCGNANTDIGRIKYVVPSGVHYILVSTKEQHKSESGVFSQPFNFVSAFDCQNADNIISYLKSQNIKKVQGQINIDNNNPGIFRNHGDITLFPVFFKKENIYKIGFGSVDGLVQVFFFAEDGSLIKSIDINTDSIINVNENTYVFAIQRSGGDIEDINIKFFYNDKNLFQKRYCDVNAVRDAVVISNWEHEKMAHVCQLYFDYDTKFFFVPYYSSMGTSDGAGEKNVVVSKISPCTLNNPTFFKPFEYGMTVGTFIASQESKFNDPNIIFLSDGVTARCLAFGGNANPEVQGQETGYFYRDFNKETLSLGDSVNICKLKYRYNGEDVIVNMTVANVTELAVRIMNKPTGPGGVLIMSPAHLVTTENEQTVIYSYLSGITSGVDGDWDGCIIKSTDYGVTWEYVSHRPNTEYLGMWEVGLALVGRKIFVLYKASKYPISYYDLDNDEWGDIVLQSYVGSNIGTDSSRPLLYYNNNILYAITNIYPRINDNGEIIYTGSGTPNSVYRSHVLIEKIDTITLERTFFKEFWHHDSCQYFSALNVYGWDYFAFTEDRRRQTTADSIKGNISMLKVDWFQQDIRNSAQESIFNK